MPGVSSARRVVRVDPVNRDEWARRASSFGSVAPQYAEYRPAYRSDAVRWCVAPTGRDVSELRVLDLGAGTGKLTRILDALGADVTAVEPDPQMRAELTRRLPSVTVLAGSAEQIPLPDQWVDAVLCAQSMHWFDLSRALPEIARVLVPGGVLGALWNDDDEQVPWVAGMARAAEQAAPANWTRRSGNMSTLQPHHFAAAQGQTQPLGPPERAEFANSQRLNADTLIRQLQTHSHVLVMERAQRERLLDALRGYLAAQPETAHGDFELPMVTTVLRAVRQG
jgi:SAM-dependent methyltransferase